MDHMTVVVMEVEVLIEPCVLRIRFFRGTGHEFVTAEIELLAVDPHSEIRVCVIRIGVHGRSSGAGCEQKNRKDDGNGETHDVGKNA